MVEVVEGRHKSVTQSDRKGPMLLKRHSDKVDALKKVPLFSELNRRHLDHIAREADEVREKDGAVLTRQGGLGREFLLILEGGARVERDGTVIARLGPGDVFGEMSLIDGMPRSASVIAEGQTVLLVIEARCFRRLLDTVPGLQRKLLITLSSRLRAADARLASIN
jgi:CRP/FNR family cyclic AMP-dependent transcriptional regulator